MLINFIKKIFLKILGFSLNQGEIRFLKNLILILLSTFFVAFLMMLVQIIGGRILGPIEYGKYSLVEAVANSLAPLILLGIPTGITYYLAKNKFRKKFYSAALLSIFVSVVVIGTLLFGTLNFWSNKFKIEYSVAFLGIFFIFPNVLRSFGNAFLRGMGKIKTLALTEGAAGFLGFILFLCLIFVFHLKNFQLIFYSKTFYLSLVFFVAFIISIPFIQKTSLKYLKKIYSYSSYVFLAQIANAAIISIDRFFMNYLLGAYSVGVYQAYYFSAQAIIFQSMQSFLLIFFPLIAGAKDKKTIIEKTEKIFFKITPLILFLDIISTLFFLKLFGRQYPLNFIWILFLGMQMTAYVIYQFYSNTLSALNKTGAKINAQYLIIGTLFFSGLSFFSIKSFGISGAILSRFMVYFLLALVYKFYILYIKEKII